MQRQPQQQQQEAANNQLKMKGNRAHKQCKYDFLCKKRIKFVLKFEFFFHYLYGAFLQHPVIKAKECVHIKQIGVNETKNEEKHEKRERYGEKLAYASHIASAMMSK